MSEIAPYTDLTPAVPGVTFTEMGLTIDENISWDNYIRLPALLEYMTDSGPFCMGDFIVDGEKVFPEIYAQAESYFLKTPKETLIVYASVARNVPPSRRRPELSFSHHRAVAKLRAAEQKRWLRDAIKGNWTAKELRDRVAGLEEGESAPSKSEVLKEAIHLAWVTSKPGPSEAGENDYVVQAPYLREIARLSGEAIPDDVIDEEEEEEVEAVDDSFEAD